MNIKNNIEYTVTIRWREEDQAYIAKVPALEGCISHGDTFEEAAEGFIESMIEHKDPIPASDLAPHGKWQDGQSL